MSPIVKKWLPIGVSAILLLCIVPVQPFVVAPSERANVRLLGNVKFDAPLKPGLHFKRLWPLENEDRLQVTLTTVHINPFIVATVDNQEVAIDMSLSYIIPDSQVNHLLYEIGRSGQADIESQLLTVAKDRTARIFAGENMVSVNANRIGIQKAVEDSIHQTIQKLFGIELESLQIAAIKPSDSFIRSNEEAVRAKNAAVAAQNTKKTRQYEADQRVIAAKGQAESVVLAAKADADRIQLQGAAMAKRIELAVNALGGDPALYVQYLKASAMNKWNGSSVPQVISTGDGQSMPIVVPISK